MNRFEKENQLFATECVWWLASLIQCTEILTYFHQYNEFPSDHNMEPRSNNAQTNSVVTSEGDNSQTLPTNSDSQESSNYCHHILTRSQTIARSRRNKTVGVKKV